MDTALAIIAVVVLGGLAITNAVLKWMSDFRKISRIVTKVYKCLQTEHWAVYQNEEELLFYTGIVAVSIRAGRGSIAVERIAEAVLRSRESLIEPSTLLPRIRGYREAEREKYRRLLNFIVGIEMLVVRSEHANMTDESLLSLLRKRVYEIEYVMVQALRRTSIPRAIRDSVDELLHTTDESEIERGLRGAGKVSRGWTEE
jgi:hypothetical protein